ncbi:Tankyrase 1 Binding Protein 1 [Saguinus oedipus]|uniref:Tankyrase 1 Binding Protein 1 n=1 Tax=Saguinus oedipus TaxID=9490 RepID=A0ABQ9UTP5_SAGOE|nr:Tankyrase 1 Binding Protein 1 [Saguinus oedipus]
MAGFLGLRSAGLRGSLSPPPAMKGRAAVVWAKPDAEGPCPALPSGRALLSPDSVRSLGPGASSFACPRSGSPPSDLAFNGDLAKAASSEQPADRAKVKWSQTRFIVGGQVECQISKPWIASSPAPSSENGGSASPGCPLEASGPGPGSPHLHSSNKSSPCHSQLLEAQSPEASQASPCPAGTPSAPSAVLPDKGSHHTPSPELPAEGVPEAPRPSSPPHEVSEPHSLEQPPATSSQPLIEVGELLDLTRTFPSSGEEVAKGDALLRPTSLVQRRFSEGVLQSPNQDQEKLGGSLAALPQGQGSQLALDHSFGAESNWSLSQSFEWTFPTRPSGLGVWRLDPPPPSPITEASEAAEAAEAGNLAVTSREEGVFKQGQGAGSTSSGSERPGSWVQWDDPSMSLTQKGDGESQPQFPAVPLEPLPAVEGMPGLPLQQAEERCELQEPLAGQESPLPLATREAALPVLEPVLGQEQPAPPDQPCVLFADAPEPGQALSVEEEAVTLALAETTEPRTEAQDSCRVSPEPAGPESSSRWLDDLLASPPPSGGGARRGAGAELKDTQSPSNCSEVCLSRDVGDSTGSWAGLPDLQLLRREQGQGEGEPAPEPSDRSQLGEQPSPVPVPGWPHPAAPRDGEASMSILERLLANAALRDEAGRLRSPEPRALPPTRGLLGWSQKDLQSEFGITGDPQPSSFSPSSWCQGASQDYGLGGASPRGDPGLGEGDWTSKYGQGAGEGSTREWASRCGITQEETEASSSQDQSEMTAPGGLTAQDRVVGKPAPLGKQRSQEADVSDWEFRKRDSQGTYSSRDAELQDQEFGKRDSLGAYSSRDVSLGDWEFGKRDSLGAYASQDANEQGRDLGKRDHHGRYGSQDADEQDWAFEKRDASLGTFGSRGVEPQEQEFGKSAWMRDYSSGGSSRTLDTQDRGFGTRPLSSGFSPEEAQQQDEEFEKKIPSVEDSLGEDSGDAGRPGERESGGLFSPSTAHMPDGALGQRDQSSWQNSDASQEVGGQQERQQAGAQGPGSADLEDGELGKRGWAGEFSLSVGPQREAAFSPGQQDWSRDFCIETSERSYQFGIIGNDRVSGAGLSPSSKPGGGHFVPPGKTTAGSVDWSDQLGLRNLEVSSCVVSGGSSEARENAVGRMGWSGGLGLRDMNLTGCLQSGGSEEPREVRVGEKDWTSDGHVKGRDLAEVGEGGGHSQARESGVGETDWSGVEAGEFLKSRERGVGQADWTPDLGLRNMAPGVVCSPAEPKELGVGQMDWGNNLGLRDLEVSCDPESGGSQGLRGCGVGQMDWTQDLRPRNVELFGAPTEAREHGVGGVGQCPEPGLQNNGSLSPGLEARDPLEARELGVGETSGPETLGEDDPSCSLEIHPADPGMEMGEALGFGAR